MNRTSYFFIGLLVSSIVTIGAAWYTVQAQNITVEESDCDQLSQYIKDSGNNTSPRHDKALSKWVALECWK